MRYLCKYFHKKFQLNVPYSSSKKCSKKYSDSIICERTLYFKKVILTISENDIITESKEQINLRNLQLINISEQGSS